MDKNFEIIPVLTTTSYIQNYCYIILNNLTKTAILVDPSWEPNKINEILKKNSSKLKSILITHSHADHVDLVNYYTNNTDVKVFISKKEANYYKFKCNNLTLFDFGKNLEIEDFVITPIHTPGHTVGSCCYLFEDNLFTGDTIFINGCGRCDLLGGNVKDMYSSIQLLKSKIPPKTKIYPGHPYGVNNGENSGENIGTTFDNIMKNNIYFKFNEYEDFKKYRMGA